DADYLVLATHASFRPGAPARSAFLLAHPQGGTVNGPHAAEVQGGCERLTLDDLWAGRLPLRAGCIVIAGACETGQVDPGAADDERQGFPAAFLGAGAAAVLASLWTVDDLSTALLLEEAVGRLRGGEAPSAALANAGRWLRR